MKLKIILSVISSTLILGGCTCSDIKKAKEITPDQIVIVQPEPDAQKPRTKAAVTELKKHLQLVTGTEIAVGSIAPSNGYAFYVGKPAPGDNRPLVTEEGRWKITPDAVFLYGDDRGTYNAVAGFLENELGIRWIMPGDIAFKKQNPLRLKLGQGGWKPAPGNLERYLWLGWTGKPLAGCPEAREFEWPESERLARKTDTAAWIARMRVAKFINWHTPHAFGQWWKKYGAEHPDYIALNAKGRREPLAGTLNQDNVAARSSRQDMQVCVSNPKVVEQVVADYLALSPRPFNINVANNDSFNSWCHCDGCRALDAVAATNANPILTDRYINFANRVAQLARKTDPNLKVHTLAYNETETPPQREKVDPNLLITYVPTDFRIDKIQATVDGWIRAGATAMRFRPNMQHYLFCGVLPLGFEKHMYDMIQVMTKYPDFVGFNCDGIQHNWAVTGFGDYMLARTISDPSKSFEYWENHYLKAFGEASGDVKKYFQHYRKIWNERVLPNYEAIVRRRCYNVAWGVAMAPTNYYTEADFDVTDGYLRQAMQRNLEPAEQARVRDLMLANEQARLIVRIAAAQGEARTIAVRALLAFRRANKNWRGVVLPRIIYREGRWGDLTGMRLAVAQAEYDPPILDTPIFWRFRPDPEKAGVTQQWFRTSADDLKWEFMATHIRWEDAITTSLPHPSEELKKFMANYDGDAWYANTLSIPKEWRDRRVFVFFGAVDDSCWVYVNGQPAGEHLYKKSGDDSQSFAIEITNLIDWKRPQKTVVMVRVEDRSGAGGIWRKVYIVSKIKP